jgi:hypothetical protein
MHADGRRLAVRSLARWALVRHALDVVPESPLEPTDHGLLPTGEGWFVLNARDARWQHRNGRGATCEFEGEPGFPQLGINLTVLEPGEPMTIYHWEADQEDFLVLWRGAGGRRG